MEAGGCLVQVPCFSTPSCLSLTCTLALLPPCRHPTTQLRWVEPDGRMMVRLEGQPAGKADGGGMRAAVAEAAGRLGKDGRWFQALLELATQS